MKWMGILLTFNIMMFAFGSTPLEASEAEVLGPRPRILSFHQWKEEQTTQANNRLVRAENQLLLAAKAEASEKQIKEIQKEKESSSQALEIAKEFTIEDYFLVYLAKLGGSGYVLREAAKVLTDDEVAELMKVFIENQQAGSSRSGSAWVPSFTKSSSKKL